MSLRAWLQRHPPALVWWLLAPALLVLLTVLVASGWTAYRGAQAALYRLESQLAAQIAAGLAQHLGHAGERVLQTLNASRDALRRGLLPLDDAEPMLQFTANQLRHQPGLTYISIAKPDGSMLGAVRRNDDSLRALRVDAGTEWRLTHHHLSVLDDLPAGLDDVGEPFDPRQHPSYRRAVESLRPGWSEVMPFRSFGSLAMGMSAPVLAADGSGLQAVVAVGVRLAEISRYLAQRFEGVDGFCFVAEADGRLIATSLPEAIARPDNNPAAERRRLVDMQDARLRALAPRFALPEQPTQQLLSLGGTRYVMDLRRVALPTGGFHVVGVLIAEHELVGTMWQQARPVVLAVAAISLAGGLLLVLLLRRVQQRVSAISEAAQRLADGDRSARAPENLAVKELHTLATSFNRMSCQVEAVLGGLEAEVASRTAALAKANAELERLVALDGLTQIANRRQFDAQLALAWRRCQRERQPLALLLVDVDDFKAYNDHYGHPAGDAVLRQVAGLLAAQQRRPDDLAARYGGEEFALLLPGASAAAARQAGELLLQALRGLGLPHEKARAARIVTASIGVAAVVPDRADEAGDGAAALIAAADTALYAAKAGGRNRVSLAPISHDEKS